MHKNVRDGAMDGAFIKNDKMDVHTKCMILKRDDSFFRFFRVFVPSNLK